VVYLEVTFPTAEKGLYVPAKLINLGHFFSRGAEERQQKEERRLADTIEDLVKEYIKKHAKVNKRSWKNDERLLNKEVVTICRSRHMP